MVRPSLFKSLQWSEAQTHEKGKIAFISNLEIHILCIYSFIA